MMAIAVRMKFTYQPDGEICKGKADVIANQTTAVSVPQGSIEKGYRQKCSLMRRSFAPRPYASAQQGADSHLYLWGCPPSYVDVGSIIPS